MKLAIMQPYFMPYVGYFQLINAVDRFVVYDDANYINRGWVNRNRILVNSKDFTFTLPLHQASQNKKINEIKLNAESKWRGKFLKTLELAYKKAPEFHDAMPVIQSCVEYNTSDLSDYLLHSLVTLCGFLEIETEIVPGTSKYDNGHLSGQDRILDICFQEGAEQYINPINGHELYAFERFEKEGIQLSFIKTVVTIYDQLRGAEFVPFLSIIDHMMFNNKAQLIKQLDTFVLLDSKQELEIHLNHG